MKRFWQIISTGEWYAGLHAKDGAFKGDGAADTAAIAASIGVNPADLRMVELADNAPDPRSGTLRSDPPSPPPPPDPFDLRVEDVLRKHGIIP